MPKVWLQVRFAFQDLGRRTRLPRSGISAESDVALPKGNPFVWAHHTLSPTRLQHSNLQLMDGPCKGYVGRPDEDSN
jgi:hypothetical protein